MRKSTSYFTHKICVEVSISLNIRSPDGIYDLSRERDTSLALIKELINKIYKKLINKWSVC